MPYSATSLAILRSMRDGVKFLLRGDRTHGCQVRYHPISKLREDRTAQILLPLEKAGMIEFASEPLKARRYYAVKITNKGTKFLEESALTCSRYSHRML